MTEEFSAGGVVVKTNGDQIQILLIKNAALRDPKRAYWGFPKGHLEKGETAEQAAIREIKEETGVDAELIEKIEDEHYFFIHPQKGKISKKVTYFFMNYLGGQEQAQEAELLELGWFSPDDALNILSFKNDKTILKKALARLEMSS